MAEKTTQNRKIHIWPIEDLTPYPNNVKKHDPAQVAKIVQAVQRFGWPDTHAIEVDKDGVILSGHGRRLAALEMGLKEVKVHIITNLSPEEAKAYRLSVNRVAVSDIDTEMLKEELAFMDLENLAGIFDAKEIDFIAADLGDMNDDVFVTDMAEVLEGQKHDIEDRVSKAADSRISLAKAFGFKDISSSGMFAITNLMAKAEAATGLKNDEALVAFSSTVE